MNGLSLSVRTAAVGAVTLAILLWLLLPVFRANVTDIGLLRLVPRAAEGGFPNCGQPQVPEDRLPAASHAFDLNVARGEALLGACGHAQELLANLHSDEAVRYRAKIALAERNPELARDELLKVAAPRVVADWLGWVGIHEVESGDDVGAAETFDAAQTVAPLTAEALQAYSTSLLHTGRADQSIEILRGLVSSDPTDAALHDELSVALWQVHPGDFEAVVEEEKAVDLRDYFPYHARLGSYYRYLDRYSEAEQQWRMVLTVGADRFDALVQLGELSDETGRTPKAAELFYEAVLLQPREDIIERLHTVCDRLIADGAMVRPACG